MEIELDMVRTIAEWPKPTCHHNIHVFLGFAKSCWCFISSFSHLAKPMTDMLKGGKNGHFSGPILPTLGMKPSFAEPRYTFTKTPVLAHIDPA
jgi:hypothetical protein